MYQHTEQANVADSGSYQESRFNASKEKTLSAEKSISKMRALVVGFNTAAYFWINPSLIVHPTADLVLIIAWFYVITILIYKPYNTLPIVFASYMTYVVDGLLIAAWIYSTGGLESPFYPLWILSVIAVSFRFSTRLLFLTCIIYSGLYSGLLLFTSEFMGNLNEIFIRIGYIFLTGGMSWLITRETFDQTYKKNEMIKLAEETRQSEEKLRLQTQLYENLINVQGELGEGVIITSGEKIIFSNDALCKLYGYSKIELTELQNVFELFSRTEKDRIKNLVQANDSGNGETLMLKKGGEFIFVSFSFKKIEEHFSNKIFFLFRDVTESKKAEADLVQRTMDLEKSKALQNKRDEFISIASHELKTPLTSIKAYIQLIERSVEEGSVQISPFIKKAGLQVDKLNNLIADLLDVSKIQAGKLLFNFSRFRFSDLVTESIDSIQCVSKSHKIILEGCVDCEIEADRQRLEQVFENFISNAIKYSPKANEVKIKVTDDNLNITVAVTDYGIGISKINQKRIFDRFYRVDESSKKFNGLGIGLYISTQIINRHNGKVWVESQYNSGSTFYFSIPKKQINNN